MRTHLLAAALVVALAACRGKPAPSLPEVSVHATVGDAAAAVLVQAARANGVADVRLVPSAAEADVFWLGDPAQVLALGDRVVPGTFAPSPDTDPRLVDPTGRFLPLCARARVFVVNPRVALPFDPKSMRDLADPRASGRVALAALTTDEGATTIAALTLRFGNASVSQFLGALARNHPLVVASDAEVRARVASGDAAFGVVGSEIAAAGAASAAGLEVVMPDQDGRGAIVVPTAVAVAAGATAQATALAQWLAGPQAEQVLVARVPGLMPLREGVPVPVGVLPTRSLRVVALIDWDRFAAEKQKVRAALRGWPDEWLGAGSR